MTSVASGLIQSHNRSWHRAGRKAKVILKVTRDGIFVAMILVLAWLIWLRGKSCRCQTRKLSQLQVDIDLDTLTGEYCESPLRRKKVLLTLLGQIMLLRCVSEYASRQHSGRLRTQVARTLSVLNGCYEFSSRCRRPRDRKVDQSHRRGRLPSQHGHGRIAQSAALIVANSAGAQRRPAKRSQEHHWLTSREGAPST
jgi:hypothetical protein